MARALTRIAHEVIERNKGAENLAIVGIVRRGANIANEIADEIEKIEGIRPPVGKLDISFYRDDVTRRVAPVIHKTEINFDVDGKDIILVDDVLFSGRTVRSALDALMDFGRPATIQLAVMVDRGHRELPISADYVGKNVPSSHEEDVRVFVESLDGRDAVEIWDIEAEKQAIANKEVRDEMLSVRNLINTTDLTADDITQILDTARSMEEINHRTIKKVPALRGRTIVNLFLEPSTRTRSSFEIAEKRLSADSLNVAGSSSSVSKGECLEDTIKTLDSYGIDMFVCRARNAGTAERITQYTDARVINAGDGKHAHPTQALLDLYTMREHFGKLDGLKVAIVGDLLHSRVVGSLAPALRTMGAKVTLVGPPTFQLPEPEVFGAEETYDFDSVIEDPTSSTCCASSSSAWRAPRFPPREYNRLWGLNAERHARMKQGAFVMHPGP